MNSPSLEKICTVPEFDLLNTPLKGHILIEASAGTGKTYTISRLFLRLLLEKELPPSSILVVTFTDAATRELKERIYLLIKDALRAFSQGNSDDPFFSQLLPGTDHEKACTLLKNALTSFDTVAIHTIHGFCQRVLYENSFESGMTFESTVITDQSELVQEITNDFWRLNFYTESPVFLAYAIQSGLSPKKFQELLRTAGRFSQNLKVIPEISRFDSTSEEVAFCSSFETLKDSWKQHRDEIVQLLGNGTLKGNKYSPKVIQDIVFSMDTMLIPKIADPTLFARFENFTPSVLNTYTKKDANPPDHPFFNLCEMHLSCAQRLQKCYDTKIIYLKRSFLEYINKELWARKSSKGLLYFDDLIKNVHSALSQGVQRGQLITGLRKSFKVALIDEFQDTDPVQYEIFSLIFDKSMPLFLIGDPKQSIYGFRGADIFTYLQASQQVTSKYTLTKNYRSDPSFLSALNTLFSKNDQPFVYDEISYPDAVAGIQDNSQQVVIEEVKQPSLQFIYIDEESAESGHPDKTAYISSSVAAEISKLISLGTSDRAKIGSEKSIKPSHIAVLVRTNREAELMHQSLGDISIPSVIDSGCSVFETNEAIELQQFLAAALEPTRSELIRAALISSFFMMDAHRIEQLSLNQQNWENFFSKFLHYHDLWRDHGFMYMFRFFLAEEHIRSKLLTLPRGERRLTNLLHISELIHIQELRQQTGMTGLHAWLLQKITNNSSVVSDEEVLRLESDEEAVTIITVHKSKGLEYPIVFCPFWHNSELRNSNEPYVFHDPDCNNEMILAIGAEEIDNNRGQVEKEMLAENMRLLYVALTRAKSICYIVWGKIRGTESSALAYLLHKDNNDPVSVAALRQKVKDLKPDEIWQTLTDLCNINPSISIFRAQTEPHPVVLPKIDTNNFSCLKFDGHIPDAWKISSFSSLTRNHHLSESPDYDFADENNAPIVENPSTPEYTIFNFPKGSTAGTFMHRIFEKIDFADTVSAQAEAIIEESLEFFNFEKTWKPVIIQLLSDTINTPLDKTNKIRLAEVSNKSCLKEMEFYFPLKKIIPADIQKLFSPQLQTDLFTNDYQAERLTFSPTHGYMKGFIDLVFEKDNRFYLLDWKSNHLGNHSDDYAVDSLKSVMKKEHYILQYHIYLTALDKYLELRCKGYSYQKNFGGVYYVFLRGVDGNAGSGVYFDRPEESVIRNLRHILIDK